MRIINTKQDILILRRAEVLQAEFLDQVEYFFLQLRYELVDEAEGEFRRQRPRPFPLLLF
ncbi:hypothetical protein [Paenibacillus cremeus]|uniref:hypothetical protein n=1 Tax=Paenibacillus cremeus TaxID=2163881 RepID=UPI0021BD85E0|nr:hypothetical protein [Paenibacillus cremeus]